MKRIYLEAKAAAAEFTLGSRHRIQVRFNLESRIPPYSRILLKSRRHLKAPMLLQGFFYEQLLKSNFMIFYFFI